MLIVGAYVTATNNNGLVYSDHYSEEHTALSCGCHVTMSSYLWVPKKRKVGSLCYLIIYLFGGAVNRNNSYFLFQCLTYMSTGNIKIIMFLGSKLRRVRRADNLTAICERLSRQCEILNISQPYRPPRPVMRIALLYGDGVCFL
jgi:hypothetical protein